MKTIESEDSKILNNNNISGNNNFTTKKEYSRYINIPKQGSSQRAVASLY